MIKFGMDCEGGNPYAHDEYNIGSSLKEAVDRRDAEEMVKLSKKPIFGFIEIEVVKPLKMMALNPPDSFKAAAQQRQASSN
eukprot:CAMPEP_0176389230 /NCGR_PEP_ID=MMETSP0126-20121128/38214_1 /TAXON_ID=141414 ORGANISM="Strombidinopsis acuminatum, Strain SPMC142" /NCGR_SAMPLE_ID=MMETSP0126 /ASSEMBLY_ACC=CAM_ASM_000229 /LENGTH=80 /DNA_ID=CAMNT_0017757927 /DNA_START=357 /DNA_END=599 /DNA_ORIENTATION=-